MSSRKHPTLSCKFDFKSCVWWNKWTPLDSPSGAPFPCHPSFEFWFCNKNSIPRPINFACKLSFAKSFLCFISLLLLEQNFPGKKPIMQSERGEKVFHSLPFFHNRLLEIFSPKKLNFAYTHNYRFGANFLPGSVSEMPCGGGKKNARESIHFSTPICIIKNHFPVMTMMKEWRRTRMEMLLGVEWQMFYFNGWFPEERKITRRKVHHNAAGKFLKNFHVF